MTPASLAGLLHQQAERICKYLLPNGKRVGHDWVAGDAYGGDGQSFKIAVTGEKVGVGADFAGTERCGDLLDLWCLTQNVGLGEAMAQASSYLGIVMDGEETKPKREFKRPERPKTVRRLDREGKVYAYLKSRGLTDQALEDFRISEDQGQWIVFPYLRNSELINTKYLHLDRPNGKKQVRQEKDAEPCLFGWHALEARFPTTRVVCLTEGEIDTITLHQCGIPALSLPNGGGGGNKQNWIENDYDRLARFDTFFLALDQDEPGRQATEEIIKRLGSERCRVVKLPHKDPNECFAKGIKDFKFFLLNAKVLDPDELKPAGHFTNKVLDRFYPKPGAYRGMSTPWPGLTRNLLFRKPELIVWFGYDGCGKSVLMNHVMLQGLLEGEKFCVASMEMPAAVTLWRLVRQISGDEKPSESVVKDIMRWLDTRLWIFDLVGSAKAARLLEVFRYAKCRYDIRNFVIDSLTKIDIREDDYSGQKDFANACTDFNNKHDSTIHLICHTRKTENEEAPPAKFDIRGASGLSNVASTEISVWRYKKPTARNGKREMAEDPNHADTFLSIEKQRETGWLGKYGLYFEPTSLQFHEQPMECGVNYHQQIVKPAHDDGTF